MQVKVPRNARSRINCIQVAKANEMSFQNFAPGQWPMKKQTLPKEPVNRRKGMEKKKVKIDIPKWQQLFM